MHRFLMIAAASLALAAPGLARAGDDPVAGAWEVHGKIATVAFVVNCSFERHGDGLAGVCIDNGTRTRHPLTAGAVAGDKVSFTYKAAYMMAKFDVVYVGLLKGGQMTGTFQVPGHAGTFTAARK